MWSATIISGSFFNSYSSRDGRTSAGSKIGLKYWYDINIPHIALKFNKQNVKVIAIDSFSHRALLPSSIHSLNIAIEQ